jgi:5-methylcytosine-specific restriction endonuclease McrA
MKHPPSSTIGRKYWLAKAWTQPNQLCPSPEVHLANGYYSFSPADFDPAGLTLPEARVEGKATTLFRPYGAIFGAQVWRMAHEVNVGDVIFLESDNRHLHAWGTITARYERRSGKYTRASLLKEGLHKVGVTWHAIKKGKDAFRIGKGDNLLFREVTERETLMPILLKFIDGPLPTGSRQGGDDAPQDLEYTEGGKVLRTHLRTERDGKAAQQAKALARKRAKNGKLKCEACECVPEDDYRGLDLIEAHHRIPLSRGVRETKPEDFAMLCPCCHRAVHKLINQGMDPVSSLNKLALLNR